MVSSETPPSACAPVVDYSRPQQARLADEVAKLPEGALIIGWLADYATPCCANRRGHVIAPF